MKLMHGDCLELLPTLPDGSVDAVVTDPPYGMAFQSNRPKASAKKAAIAGDERPFIWFLPQAFRVLKAGGAIVCFTDWKNQEIWRVALECAGFTVRSHCVWDRGVHGMGDLKASFAPQHDVFWFATKGAFAFTRGRPKSVMRHLRPSREATPHPTAKPDELMTNLCRSVCPEGGVVLDPFMGSGATGAGAAAAGCGFIGMELDRGYFDFAVQKLATAAGVFG